MAEVFKRAQVELSDCWARCSALTKPAERTRACRACVEFAPLKMRQQVTKCHTQVCQNGRSVNLAPRIRIQFRSVSVTAAHRDTCRP